MAHFMTAAWANACHSAINEWPGDERRASKLQEFWDWISMVRPFVTGRLALNVRDMPPYADGDTPCAGLRRRHGDCRVGSRPR